LASLTVGFSYRWLQPTVRQTTPNPGFSPMPFYKKGWFPRF